MLMQRFLSALALSASVLSLSWTPTTFASTYIQTNLVGNTSGVAADTDPNLVNPWGISFSATSPFWIADQVTNLATVYTGLGVPQSLVVAIPASVTPPSGPTGTVFNGTTGFLVNGTPSHFIFDTLQGTVAAWASGSSATTVVTTPGAVYTGLALASVGTNNYLYAANSAPGGTVQAFDTNFNHVTLTGNFVDPSLPGGYVPFNVQAIGAQLYVTYAQLGARGIPITGSTGYVDVFNPDGTFVRRLATGGSLFAPWGITLAPSSFGEFGNDFLIGNFGNGEINAFTSAGAFAGTLDGTNGQPIVDPFLWALDFRTGGPNVDPNALYFTAGINNQMGGLFGEIVPTPEPAPLFLVGLGLVGIALLRLRSQYA